MFVVLYDLSESDELALDRWEVATPALQQDLNVRVATLEGDTLWLYVLNDYEAACRPLATAHHGRRRGGGGRPSRTT